MTRKFLYTATASACIVLCSGSAIAQFGRGGGGWSTAGGDAQRTGWVRTDPQISKENIGKGIVQFLWKTRLDNAPRQMHALTPPAVIGRVITYKGFKDLMFIAGSSDTVWSIDHPLGKVFWEAKLPYAATYPQQRGGTPACPGGMTAAVTMAASFGAAGGGAPGPPAAPAAGVGGRGGRGGDAAGAAAAGRGAPPPGLRLPGAMYALSSDGLLHIMNQHSGGDISPAPKFVRPNALARGLVVIDNLAYVATTGNCGRTPNGIWAMDLNAPVRELSTQKWWSGNANIEGSAGFAFGADGTVYAATGDGAHDPANGEFGRTVVALESKTLKLKDWFTPAGEAGFKTAPVFFNHKDKDYLAVTGQEGRIYLLDAASLGGSNHQTPVSVTPPYSTGAGSKGTWGALATWQDSDGTRWILAPVAGALTADTKFPTVNGDTRNGSIVAFKVVDQGGKPSLQPAWVSRDLTAPAAPIVVNGVVFALSTGEYLTPANTTPTSEQRVQRSTPAVLYALDPATGKDIWSSAKSITGFSSSGGLASNASKVFVSTHDGTLYAFGYLLNRD